MAPELMRKAYDCAEQVDRMNDLVQGQGSGEPGYIIIVPYIALEPLDDDVCEME